MVRRYEQENKAEKSTPSSPLRTTIARYFNLEEKNNQDINPQPPRKAENETENQPDTPSAVITDTSAANINASDLHQDFILGELSREEARDIVKNSVVHGNPNASVLFVQFCDYTTSTYCKEFFKDWAMFSYQETLKNNLAYVYKSFPSSFSEEVLLPHKAMVCVKNSGSPQQVLWFHNALYQQSENLDISVVWKINNELNLPPIAECLTNKFTLLALQNDMKENKNRYDITSLPTNIILNLNSWKRVKVPWYYSLEDMTTALLYVEQQQ